MPSIRIPPSESGHEHISYESSEHDEEVFVHLRYSRAIREKYSHKHENHPESEEFATRIGNKAKLRSESCLEIAHERAIHEPKESKKTSNKNPE